MMLVISHAIEPLYFRQNWFFWHFFFCVVFLSSWRFRICLTFVLGCPGSKVMDVYFFVFICMTNLYCLTLCQKNVTIASKKFHDGCQLKFCGSNPRNMYFMPHHSAKVGLLRIFEIFSFEIPKLQNSYILIFQTKISRKIATSRP